MQRRRNRVNLALRVTLLAAAGGWVVSSPCPAQSCFRGNPAHTGVFAGPGPKRLSAVKWRFAAGGRVMSSPVLSQGALFFGSDDRHVYSVDAETGRQRWRFATGGPVPGTPAVAGGLVYFTSYDGKLYAVDEQTGKLRWKLATGGERRFEAKGLHGYQPPSQTFADPWDIFLSSPVVGQGAVYFGSGDGFVYALDAASGVVRWKVATGDVVHSSPAFDAGTVIVAGWDSVLYALDAGTGQEKWRFKGGEDPQFHNQVGFQSSPAIVDGVVYIGCRDSNLYAIDASTGKERWRVNNRMSWVVTSPAVAQGKVLFGTSDTSLLRAVDIATGKPVFQVPLGAYVFSSPAIAGDVAYVGVMNGSLVAVDLGSGQIASEFRTEASRRNRGWALKADGSKNEPMLFRGGYFEGELSLDRLFAVGSVASSPLVANGVVFFGSTDGYLYAVH